MPSLLKTSLYIFINWCSPWKMIRIWRQGCCDFIFGGSLHYLELLECRCMKKPGQMQWHGWQLRFAGGWVGCVSSWTDQAALHLHTHGVLKSFLDEGILLLLLRLWCMPDRKFGWLVVLFFSFESRIVWFHIVTAFAQLSHVFFWN